MYKNVNILIANYARLPFNTLIPSEELYGNDEESGIVDSSIDERIKSRGSKCNIKD